MKRMAATTIAERIQFAPLSELRCWERNYRTGDVDAIARSITRFGFNTALRVWKGEVMAGNHALKALHKLKIVLDAPPAGIVASGNDWIVPIIDISALSRVEAESFAIADNRTQELGIQDEGALAQLLSELAAEDIETAQASGYSIEQIEALLGADFEPVDESEQPPMGEPKKATCPECGHEFAL